MCGINGFNYSDKKLIVDMNIEIKHRGPDGSDTFVNSSVSLGHVRLSIIDLSIAGSQPMKYFKNSNIQIVFNGEIYNYLEIKSILINKGYEFDTESDTEVILVAYIEWGVDCVDKFNGMWAFTLYDMDKNIFFLSRDRLGVKPLYYFYDGKNFIFSSEIKGILKHENLKINSVSNIDAESVELYFSLEFIPSPKTIYKNVFKLEARQNLIFDLKTNKILKKWYYYELPKYRPIRDKLTH